ncbi:disabled homolog 1-like [Neolamprologus brichardi]|uniref:disabled homolog 1-like n=1 Tax=Neolamprologus brichardi TaxID=32507 RepID=UPI001643A9FF|nr:disabled homolog 1-like [Neolamprologus brichardi]
METQQTAGSFPALSQTTVTASITGATMVSMDTMSRFHGEGVRYKAKLIGMDPVPDAIGEKMCRDSMMKLKGFEVAGRKQGIHKRRIWLKISSSGLKILDERTGAVLYDQERSRISSLTKDESDPRALAYIYQHQDNYILFYIKMANLAHPVFLDIQEVCQHVDREISQQPAETPTQGASLLVLHKSSAAEEPALEDLFSPRPDVSSQQTKQPSSTNELMEVFSTPLEEPLAQTRIPEPPQQQQQVLSSSQILSMFPTHPVGGSPYSSPTYPPASMPWGQQALPGNQWAAPWPTAPGNISPWAPPGVTVSPTLSQAPSMANPLPGFMMAGNAAPTPSGVNIYSTPLNSLNSTPTGTTAAPLSVSSPLENPSLL